MGNIYDYFSAPDDEAALAAQERGGPEEAGLPTLSAKGIDPCVELGKGQSLLTGLAYDDVVKLPRFADLLGDPEGANGILVTLADELRDALATATPELFRQVAEPWSRIEEFPPGMYPEDLVAFLTELAEMAVRARSEGHRLYCVIFV
ncbi:hypothetical protein OG562_18895 [Streptomyces sp. NBC_01275]|uniref:hypothetical protein n=1 Tax=Streptomyces sp. NBC_01275 TaxID=2903807 RepID=UPI0022561E65|nr:hypothetical protein [Streptomyces sp. NBC_01275]MCX4763009.1 hypothetical protein [Streptomyces sp. NBC_01275]